MNDVTLKINRLMIGIAAAVCLSIAGYGFSQLAPREDWPQWLGALIRIGLMLAAVWLASAKWFGAKGSVEVSLKTLVAIIAVLVALSLRPRIAVPAIGVIAGLWFIVRPRKPKHQIDRSKNRK